MSTNSKLLYSKELIHHDFVPTSFVLIKFFEAKLFSGIKLKPLSNQKSVLKRTCNMFEFVPLMIASKIYMAFKDMQRSRRCPFSNTSLKSINTVQIPYTTPFQRKLSVNPYHA